MERGLLQGDPISPCVFLMVAEALQITMLEACNKNFLEGNGDGTNISPLQYADDILFFGEWSVSNAKNLLGVLSCFQDASALRVNL